MLAAQDTPARSESLRRSASLPNPQSASDNADESWTSPWYKSSASSTPWWSRSGATDTVGSSSSSAVVDSGLAPRRTASTPNPSTSGSRKHRRRRHRKGGSSENASANARPQETVRSNASTSTAVLKSEAQRLVKEAKAAAHAKAQRSKDRHTTREGAGGDPAKHREWIRRQKRRAQAEGRSGSASQLGTDHWLMQARWVRDTGGPAREPEFLREREMAGRVEDATQEPKTPRSRARDVPSRSIGASVEDIFRAPGGVSNSTHQAHKLGLADMLNRAR